MMQEAPIQLRCEYLHNPLGLTVTRPRLSWWVNDPRPAELQSAYQIQAASQPDTLRAGLPDRWDSGHVSGARTAGVVWGGRPLRARDRVWWRVRCYDSDGLPSPWSEPAHFEMGLLHPADWRGTWIAAPLAGTPTTSVPLPLLWRDFDLAEAPASARLYVAVLGAGRIRINGADVDDREPLAPWTDLDQRVPYRVLDVGRLLTAGPNRIAVLLADGDYCGRLAGAPRQRHGPQPLLCAQLELVMRPPPLTSPPTGLSWSATRPGDGAHPGCSARTAMAVRRSTGANGRRIGAPGREASSARP
jgi:alpha-L-rhamnosidase